ncbi:histidine kinase [Pontibacillus chungwhensis BH030062]|uniref:histidine kinase n=1 Tax=Pontibacillus chungwhensis BH030062 TaxID=1385513 RepID=A0A0A2V0P7_9BACI|nr:HAMP domain-containing sensor histidine kinase [Pontibacillus chungwhensis]KGP92613.1 histidine kinase [Pontibacillus chungwhensis BH030062]
MKDSVLTSWSIWTTIALILMGITMPLWLSIDMVGLSSAMEKLNEDPSGSTLMMTAFTLVMLNTIRALPHYLGALLLGDILGRKFEKPWLKVAVPFVVIPLVYASINAYSAINYHFGGPAFLILMSIVLMHMLSRDQLRPVLKSFVLAQLLFGYQWLDTVTFLTPFGFGGGAISSELKDIAVSLEFGATLSFYSIVLCSIFVINAVMLAVYLAVSAQKWKIKQDLNRARGEMIESRSGREALHLVHDLKTPLALIEGLNSLIQMKTKNQEILDYTDKISESIQSTSNMVSEILYDEKKNWCSMKRLIEYIRANKLSYADISFEFELNANEHTEVLVNKIRMTRAMVNLIDNACDAVEGVPDAHVIIRTEKYGEEIWLGVEDNGNGIPKKEQQKIWKPGFSTKSHPGFGLTFVKNVVAEHDATLHIESDKNQGTLFWIQLPKERVSYEHSNH